MIPYRRNIAETESEEGLDYRLGRHVYHDPRSRAFAVPTDGLSEISVSWARRIPILDQGSLGSCTGNAAMGALGTSPLFEVSGDAASKAFGTGAWKEAGAVSLYGWATAIDTYPGTYPPDDTGSDGLSVAKAMQTHGLAAGYLHAFSLADMVKALQVGPGMIGINWYSSFDAPAADGTLKLTSTSYVRGGHELAVTGVDVSAQVFLVDNSWGAGWGVRGSCRIPYAVMERLLSESGDFTQPVPISAPAPVPTPTPVATADDLKLWAASKAWALTKGLK
jgi:hypothetical protein